MKPKIKVEAHRKGLEDQCLERAFDLVLNQFQWVIPTRFSESEENYQAIGEDPVSDCMSLVQQERAEVVVKGRGGVINFLALSRTAKNSEGSLTFWASSSTAFKRKDTLELEHELIAVTKALHSPHAAAYDDEVEDVRSLYDVHDPVDSRDMGYKYGLLAPKWREVLGPQISSAMLGGLRKLEGLYSKNVGDGYWLLRTYESPEDGLTEEGRAREEEIVDVLGRRFFYDFQTEEQAYFRLEEGEKLW